MEKAKNKIAEFQAKYRDLERQRTELENTEIVSIVRSMDISLADLAVMLKATKNTTSGHVDPKPQKKEENN